MNSNAQKIRELVQVQQDMLRPARHVNIEGSFELGWGAAMLCFGIVSYLPAWLHPSRWTTWLTILLFICAVLCPYLIPKAVKRLFTWPRSGYVVYRHYTKANRTAIIVSVVVAVLISVGLPYFASKRALLQSSPVAEQPQASGSSATETPQHREWHPVTTVLASTLLLAGVGLYFARNSIMKRMRSAAQSERANVVSDANLERLLNDRRYQMKIKCGVILTLIAMPAIALAMVWALICLVTSVTRQRLDSAHLGMLGLILGANALLYLMANGACLKRYPWKWLCAAALIVIPLLFGILVPDVRSRPAMSLPLSRAVILALGALWLISGLATLGVYLRSTPDSGEPEQP